MDDDVFGGLKPAATQRPAAGATEETIGGYETGVDELIDGFVMVEERRAFGAQRVEDFLGTDRQDCLSSTTLPRGGVIAREDADAGGQLRPADFTCQTKRVENRGIIAIHSRRENESFPRVR